MPGLCADCIKGVTHEGTPKGTWEEIGGVKTYVATPTVDYAKDKAILYLSDILGPQHINSQLLIDDFAAHGFKIYAVDYLNGDPVPPEALNSTDFDIPEWESRHGREVTRPNLDKVIAALQKEGITTFGATGYCFGGRYTFDLAIDNIIKAAVVAHPVDVEVPEDLERYFATSKAPLLINSCPADWSFPPEACAKADEIFGEGKFAPGYKRESFEGVEHGFAVRGDMKNDKVRAAKQGAFEATVKWFLMNL